MERDNRRFFLDVAGLSELINRLKEHGYAVYGPRVRDSIVVLGKIAGAEDLPAGYISLQSGGKYFLEKKEIRSFFAFANGHQSWKKYLYPPRETVFAASRFGKGFKVKKVDHPSFKAAFLGVRPCDLAAIGIQDKVLMEGTYKDASYSARRKEVFVIAVNCVRAGGTCFCLSMGTGPAAASGFDMALTEVEYGDRHFFILEVGSRAGEKVANSLSLKEASAGDISLAEEGIRKAASSMGRELDTDGIKELFYSSYESRRWEEVSERCLACGNCTMVCPTCYCSTVEDVTDLSGDNAERHRVMDSCFSREFSYIHGGSVRSSISGRYRQWITHKLASWTDQYGVSGCVGCGRCITWCPVGIDITEEAAALRKGGEQ